MEFGLLTEGTLKSAGENISYKIHGVETIEFLQGKLIKIRLLLHTQIPNRNVKNEILKLPGKTCLNNI